MACSDDTVSPTDLQPVLASISPDSGNVGTAVELRGSQFAKGAVVLFGSMPSPRVSYLSATRVRAYAPDGIVLGESYAVKVRNASSDFADASKPYRAVAPELTVVNGVSKPSGTPGSTVVFEGRSFGDLVGKGTVYFTGNSGPVEAPVTIAANWSNEFIIAEVPGDAITGPVWVDTPLGATDGIEFRIVEAATFSPSQIQWTQTASLPAPSQGHGAHFLSIEDAGNVDNVVFVTGGADGTPTARTDVLVGEIDATGQVVSWSATTPLPEARAFHATEIATPWNALVDTTVAGYLYEIGGINATGDVQSTVLFTAVARDRSLAGWAPTTALPVALHSAGAAILRSWLYVVGGATTADAPRGAAYRARILEDGQLGAWESLPALPSARAYAPLVQWAGHLYVLGGDTAASTPGSNSVPNTTTKSILMQTIDLRTGGFKNSAWTGASSQLIKSVSKHSVIVAGGWLLASGGLYNGASSSATEHQYASIDVDGSVTSFNGATGSQTITSAGGVPFYNHTAITYVDDAGVAHVIIIGGNNVTNSAAPTANCYYY
ncbi:MAG TPA: hypothetical protein VF247_11670 [Candidatus Krumholzibacteria bacterium]